MQCRAAAIEDVGCCALPQSRQALDMLAAMEAALEPARPILDLCLQARSRPASLEGFLSACKNALQPRIRCCWGCFKSREVQRPRVVGALLPEQAKVRAAAPAAAAAARVLVVRAPDICRASLRRPAAASRAQPPLGGALRCAGRALRRSQQARAQPLPCCKTHLLRTAPHINQPWPAGFMRTPHPLTSAATPIHNACWSKVRGCRHADSVRSTVACRRRRARCAGCPLG